VTSADTVDSNDSAKAASKSDRTENPYLNARREWNERYGEYIVRERAWRSIAFFLAAIALFAVLGIVWSSSQNKLIPYVVEIDKFGDAFAARRADQATLPDTRVERAQLARWIADIRSVYLDAAAERKAVLDGYAMLDHGGAAYGMLNDYMRLEENNPFKRAEHETVAIDVQSVLPLTAATWRLEWMEIVRDREGHETSHLTWTATVSISIRTPTEEKEILENPTGLFVESINWSKRL
jgi:type IV secretion system protein TrbF